MRRANVPRTESPPPGPFHHLARVIVLVGLIVGGVAAGDWVQRQARLRAWRAALTETRPEQIPAHLRAALWLGTPGKSALIEVLDARPAALGLAARDVLRDHFKELRRTELKHHELTSLARELAAASRQFTSTGQRRAAELALGLLEQSPGRGEAGDWVADCQAVLEVCGFPGRGPESAGRARVVAAIDRGLKRPETPPALLPIQQPGMRDVFPALAQLSPPSGGAPSAGSAPATSSPTVSMTGGATAGELSGEIQPPVHPAERALRGSTAGSNDLAGAPLLVNPLAHAPPGELPQPLREGSPVQGAEESEDAGDLSPEAGPDTATVVRPLGHAAAAGGPLEAGEAEPWAPPGTTASLVERFRGLHDGDPGRAEAARRSLAERGFSSDEIAVGWALSHPNPAQRRRLVEELPQRPVDAKPWLVAASRDAAPAVRRAAVSIMATSQDTELLARVAELARTDADAEVRRLAERAGRGR